MRIPPESWCGSVVLEAVEVDAARRTPARARRASARERPRARSGKTRFCRTVSQGKSAGSWNTSSRSGPGPFTCSAVDRDAPAARLEVAGERVEQGRLSAPRRAEQADELAGVHLDVHVAQRDHLVPRSGGRRAETSILGGPVRAHPRHEQAPPRAPRASARGACQTREALADLLPHTAPMCVPRAADAWPSSDGPAGAGADRAGLGGSSALTVRVKRRRRQRDAAVPDRQRRRSGATASRRSRPRSGPRTATSQPRRRGRSAAERAPRARGVLVEPHAVRRVHRAQPCARGRLDAPRRPRARSGSRPRRPRRRRSSGRAGARPRSDRTRGSATETGPRERGEARAEPRGPRGVVAGETLEREGPAEPGRAARRDERRLNRDRPRAAHRDRGTGGRRRQPQESRIPAASVSRSGAAPMRARQPRRNSGAPAASTEIVARPRPVRMTSGAPPARRAAARFAPGSSAGSPSHSRSSTASAVRDARQASAAASSPRASAPPASARASSPSPASSAARTASSPGAQAQKIQSAGGIDARIIAAAASGALPARTPACRLCRPMRLGFDAKRAFHNATGLGNYSRDVLRILQARNPEHEYLAYTPRPGRSRPPRARAAGARAARRARPGAAGALAAGAGSCGTSRRDGVALYHGLSNELPAGIERTRDRAGGHDPRPHLRAPSGAVPRDRSAHLPREVPERRRARAPRRGGERADRAGPRGALRRAAPRGSASSTRSATRRSTRRAEPGALDAAVAARLGLPERVRALGGNARAPEEPPRSRCARIAQLAGRVARRGRPADALRARARGVRRGARARGPGPVPPRPHDPGARRRSTGSRRRSSIRPSSRASASRSSRRSPRARRS